MDLRLSANVYEVYIRLQDREKGLWRLQYRVNVEGPGVQHNWMRIPYGPTIAVDSVDVLKQIMVKNFGEFEWELSPQENLLRGFKPSPPVIEDAEVPAH